MNRSPIILLVAFVLVAGTVTAGLFGWFAGYGYAIGPYPIMAFAWPVAAVGEWWGAITGLIAAAVWCRIMVPRALRAPRRGWAGAGASAGLAVGWLSTILIHAVLMGVADRAAAALVMIGLVCATAAGLILGAVCGGLCGAAARRARPEPDPDEEAAAQ